MIVAIVGRLLRITVGVPFIRNRSQMVVASLMIVAIVEGIPLIRNTVMKWLWVEVSIMRKWSIKSAVTYWRIGSCTNNYNHQDQN